MFLKLNCVSLIINILSCEIIFLCKFCNRCKYLFLCAYLGQSKRLKALTEVVKIY